MTARQTGSSDGAERERLAEQLDHFFDHSSDLMCVVGYDGYFKRVNPAWQRALGHTLDDLLRTPYIDFVHPDDVERTLTEVANRTEGRIATVGFQNRYRCRDGSYRWLT